MSPVSSRCASCGDCLPLAAVAQLVVEVGLDFFFVLDVLFVLGFVVVVGFLIVVCFLIVLDLFCLGPVKILVVVGSAARAVAVSPLFCLSLVLSSLRVEDRG